MKSKEVNTNKPIRLSRWTVVEKSGKKTKYIVDDIIVSGNEEDIESIKKDSLYLGSVYKSIYGKEKFMSKRREQSLSILNVVLDEKILGYTIN